MGSLMQKGHRIRIARHRGWLFQSDSAIDAGADAQDDRVGALRRMPGLVCSVVAIVVEQVAELGVPIYLTTLGIGLVLPLSLRVAACLLIIGGKCG